MKQLELENGYIFDQPVGGHETEYEEKEQWHHQVNLK